MSDRQTTAVLLLVFLSIVFYLYNQNRLTSVVSAITGSGSPNLSSTIAGVSAGIAGNVQVTSSSAPNPGSAMQSSEGNFLNALYGVTNGQANTSPPTQVASGTSPNGTDLNSLANLASDAGTIATIFS